MEAKTVAGGVPGWLAVGAVLVAGVVGWLSFVLLALTVVAFVLLWLTSWQRSMKVAATVLGLIWVGFWGAVSFSVR